MLPVRKPEKDEPVVHRARARMALKRFYQYNGLPAPRVFWARSPRELWLAATILIVAIRIAVLLKEVEAKGSGDRRLIGRPPGGSVGSFFRARPAEPGIERLLTDLLGLFLPSRREGGSLTDTHRVKIAGILEAYPDSMGEGSLCDSHARTALELALGANHIPGNGPALRSGFPRALLGRIHGRIIRLCREADPDTSPGVNRLTGRILALLDNTPWQSAGNKLSTESIRPLKVLSPNGSGREVGTWPGGTVGYGGWRGLYQNLWGQDPVIKEFPRFPGHSHLRRGFVNTHQLDLLFRRFPVEAPSQERAGSAFIENGIGGAILLNDYALLAPHPRVSSFAPNAPAGLVPEVCSDSLNGDVSARGPGYEPDPRLCVRLSFPDGYDYFAYGGRVLGPEYAQLIRRGEHLSLADLNEIRTREGESVLQRILGRRRFLEFVGAEVSAKDVDNQGNSRILYRLPVADEVFGEKRSWLEVTCPSTGEKSLLEVPGYIETPREAVAWTFGERPEDYHPNLES